MAFYEEFDEDQTLELRENDPPDVTFNIQT